MSMIGGGPLMDDYDDFSHTAKTSRRRKKKKKRSTRKKKKGRKGRGKKKKNVWRDLDDIGLAKKYDTLVGLEDFNKSLSIDKKYADRGSAGKKQSAKEKRDLTSQTAKDLDLIESYGIDAPKARSFQTQRKKDGGKVRAMKLGGAVMPGRGPKFKGQS